jgi:hypothetical protein
MCSLGARSFWSPSCLYLSLSDVATFLISANHQLMAPCQQPYPTYLLSSLPLVQFRPEAEVIIPTTSVAPPKYE